MNAKIITDPQSIADLHPGMDNGKIVEMGGLYWCYYPGTGEVAVCPTWRLDCPSHTLLPRAFSASANPEVGHHWMVDNSRKRLPATAAECCGLRDRILSHDQREKGRADAAITAAKKILFDAGYKIEIHVEGNVGQDVYFRPVI